MRSLEGTVVTEIVEQLFRNEGITTSMRFVVLVAAKNFLEAVYLSETLVSASNFNLFFSK
jgi:hypothetical protein